MMSNSQHRPYPEWFQTVLTPVSDETPCGENPEYNSKFILLLSQLEPRMGAEYGNFVEAAEPVNWVEIERECRLLLSHTKDIRIIIIFIRCMVRQHGAIALAEGLELLLQALKIWPDNLHPQLADEGEFDPIMRANALAELAAHEGLMADLRQISLPGVQGIVATVRDIEKANQIPREEGALPSHTLENMLNEWHQHSPDEIIAFYQAAQYLQELESLMAQTLQEAAPDISRLRLLVECFTPRHPKECIAPPPQAKEREFAAICHNTPVLTEEPLNAAPSVSEVAHTLVHRSINSRHDALNQIQELRAWFIRTEPSSPADGLLHLTEQIIGKNFSELFKLLPQELIAHLTNRQD
ncbi:hypothetical protein GWD52_06275 [Enterobacteriaceae bacterium 4M9]|nr:hypothetical protein [Enterobacteriaceae bacterium 4M9]